MADYPASQPTFLVLTDKVDLVAAEDQNQLRRELAAALLELGTDPAGTATDVKTRLYVCIDNNGAIRQGTSFPGSPIAGQVFYRTDTDVFYIRNAANSAWISLGQSLADLIFHWGTSGGNRDNGGLYVGTDQTIADPATNANKYSYWAVTSQDAYKTVFAGKFKKIPGVSTLTIYGRIWTDGTASANLKVDVGGQNNNGSGTSGQLTPEWVTYTIDVSSLTNNSVYNITISLKNTNAGSGQPAYVDEVFAFGS